MRCSRICAAAALLARTAHPPVLADAVAAALLHTLRCRPCSQPAARGCRRRILCKPRCRPCSQMLLSPHSLQSLRRLPCSQMLLPPHSLHWLRLRPYSQHRCRHRTPCTRCVASRDHNSRCFCRRSPCRGSAAARARICWRYRTHRTGGGAARARRGSFSTTPKTPTRRTHPKHGTQKTAVFCFLLSLFTTALYSFFSTGDLFLLSITCVCRLHRSARRGTWSRVFRRSFATQREIREFLT